MVWTVWQNVRYLANQVLDPFINKFQQGTATITNPATTVTVVHTLGIASYQVQVVPLGDPVSRYWVSGKTSSQFVINLSAAPAGSMSFDWSIKAV